jgi:hypothetical protein
MASAMRQCRRPRQSGNEVNQRKRGPQAGPLRPWPLSAAEPTADLFGVVNAYGVLRFATALRVTTRDQRFASGAEAVEPLTKENGHVPNQEQPNRLRRSLLHVLRRHRGAWVRAPPVRLRHLHRHGDLQDLLVRYMLAGVPGSHGLVLASLRHR